MILIDYNIILFKNLFLLFMLLLTIEEQSKSVHIEDGIPE
jgi:hypothetical protein